MSLVYKKILLDLAPDIPKFEKRVYVNRDGMFKVALPPKVALSVCLDKDTDEDGTDNNLYSFDLRKLEEEFKDHILQHKKLVSDYELVIKYTVTEVHNMDSGYGIGLQLYWGVYKKVNLYDNDLKSEIYCKYFFERGMETSIHWIRDNLKKMNEMEHTDDREAFFKNLEEGIGNIKEKLIDFMGNNSLESFIDKKVPLKLA